MAYYKEIPLQSWAEFKNLAEKSMLEWIFRGQSNAEWDLETSLERSKIVADFPEFEEQLIEDFKRGAKFYLENEQLPTTLLEWYSMIQHFGAPSRLLDFSKSPYIAAYFAFEQANINVDKVAIWVIDKNGLYQRAKYYLKNKIDKTSSNHYAYDDNTFEKVFVKSKQDEINCLFPVEPYNVNQRYHLQQSIFICQGNPYETFLKQVDFLGDIVEKVIMKVTIPVIERKKAMRDLEKMNITRASLFPGLDGFAKSLFLKYSNLLTLGDTFEFLKYAEDKRMV
jgi:hypothetical protein